MSVGAQPAQRTCYDNFPDGTVNVFRTNDLCEFPFSLNELRLSKINRVNNYFCYCLIGPTKGKICDVVICVLVFASIGSCHHINQIARWSRVEA